MIDNRIMEIATAMIAFSTFLGVLFAMIYYHQILRICSGFGETE